MWYSSFQQFLLSMLKAVVFHNVFVENIFQNCLLNIEIEIFCNNVRLCQLNASLLNQSSN